MLLSEFFVKDFSNQTATMLLHFSVLLPCWVRTAERKFWFFLPPPPTSHWRWPSCPPAVGGVFHPDHSFPTRIQQQQKHQNIPTLIGNRFAQNIRLFSLLFWLLFLFLSQLASDILDFPPSSIRLGGDGDVGGGRLFHPVLLPLFWRFAAASILTTTLTHFGLAAGTTATADAYAGHGGCLGWLAGAIHGIWFPLFRLRPEVSR